MPIGIHKLSAVIRIFVVLSVCAVVIPTQTPRSSLTKILTRQAAFDEADLAALEKGEIVVKVLAANNKDKEVGVFGVVRVSARPDISLSDFQSSLEQKTNEAVVSQGRFSSPPVLDDLKGLKLEKNDLKDLRICEVGDCDLKMSAAMIQKLRAEVDWNADESDFRADQIFRQMIVDYVTDYSQRGHQALLQYDGRREPVRLIDEYRLLFERSSFVEIIAPTFSKYLIDFPRTPLAGVSNNITWSKVTFGLKPMLTVTHSAAYEERANELSQYLIATKQIYASRYMNASLAFSMLVRVADDNGVNTYLIFSDVSRSDDLSGAFSGLKRSLVGSEATKRVKDLLQRSKVALEKTSTERNETKETPIDGTGWIRGWEWTGNRYLQAAIVILFVLGGFWLYRRWSNNRPDTGRDQS